MDLVKPGRYTAKVVDHGVTETKGGLPQATVRFSFETPDGPRELTWFGSFKELAVEHTIKALVACGLRGNNPGGDLEIGKEVSIVVAIDQNQNGDDRNVIQWVNPLGGILNKVEPSKAKAMLERFSGAVMAFKEKNGLNAKNVAPTFDSNEEIPF